MIRTNRKRILRIFSLHSRKMVKSRSTKGLCNIVQCCAIYCTILCNILYNMLAILCTIYCTMWMTYIVQYCATYCTIYCSCAMHLIGEYTPQKLRNSHCCVPFTATFSKRRKIGALWSERCDRLSHRLIHEVISKHCFEPFQVDTVGARANAHTAIRNSAVDDSIGAS